MTDNGSAGTNVSIRPHPYPDGMGADEIRNAIDEAEEQVRLARKLKNTECETWFTQEVRFLEAALARRNGLKQGRDGGRTALIRRVSEIEREEVAWLWLNRIPLGKLTLFDGDPGLGKSWLTLAIAAAVSRGWALPGDVTKEPRNVVIMSAEDGPGDTIRPRLEDLGADLERIVLLEAVQEKGKERMITLADLDIIEAIVIREKAVLVIVDPVIAYVAGVDTYVAAEVRSLLAPLAALAHRIHCAVVGVRHLSKKNIPALYRGQGSIDFLAACRSAFLIGQDPDNPDLRALVHLKCNLSPKASTLTFSIDEGRFLWGPESTLTAEQVLAVPAEGEGGNALTEAKEFLATLLAGGPIPAKEVKREAREAGVSEITLKRAKASLGIKAQKNSFDQGWTWKLPAKEAKEAQGETMSPFEENDPLRHRSGGCGE